MNYRSIADLNDDTFELAQSLPSEIDLVVGIPRSGLLAANLLCLYLHTPMTDVDGLLERELLATGNRHAEDLAFEDVETVLVVDDSVYTGETMRETNSRIDDSELPFEVEYGAVYVTREGDQFVDYWSEFVPRPRAFEWNIMHRSALGQWCVDVDGVLCRDPTPEENDDGEQYREFLASVEPKIVPKKRIGWLVTARLEQYRPETEAWLDRHGIEYDDLIMLDLPDKETRRKRGSHAEFKADVYRSSGATLFVESDPRQAEEIAVRSNRPVFCFETKEMIRPGYVDQTYGNGREYAEEFVRNPISFSKKAIRFVCSRGYHRARRELQ